MKKVHIIIRGEKAVKTEGTLRVYNHQEPIYNHQEPVTAALEFRHKEWLLRLETLQTFDQSDV